MTLHQWAIRHGVTNQALYELQILFGTVDMTVLDGDHAPRSEAAVQAAVRAEATAKGGLLMRNNRGAGKMESGSFVRFGLANDTEQMNKVIKSSDLIGIHRLLITPDLVGSYVGQFDAAEIKKEDWSFSGTEEEIAQLAFLRKVVSLGGRGQFINRVGML